MVLEPWSQGVARSSFNSKLVPDSDQIVALVELHLVGNESRTVLLIGRILEVPVPLLLLDETSQGPLVLDSDALLEGAPHFEVLGGVAVLILARSLPRDEERTTRGEADLVDIDDGQCQDYLATGGVDDCDGLRRGVAEEAAAGRVVAASKVSFRLDERRD